MKLPILDTAPISVSGGAVYPYSESLLEYGQRKTKYDDEYNMFRVIGNDKHKRILVPRNMSPVGGEDNRLEGIDVKFKSTFVPRNAEQKRVIDETSMLLNMGVSFMTEAPTGFGKTWCGCDVIAKVGKKTIVVVTKEDLVDQWNEALKATLGLSIGNGVGLIRGDVCQTAGNHVVIAMVQSLAKESRYPESSFRDFGLAIWDETHRVAADFFSQSCYRLPAKLRWGISATPYRKDGRNDVLQAHIGPVRVRSDAAPMQFRVIKVRSPWVCPARRKLQKDGTYTMVQVPHSAGRTAHVEDMLAKHFPRNKLIADFVVAAHRKGRRVLVQSNLLAHLQTLAELVTALGVPPGDIGHYAQGVSKEAREVVKSKRVIFASYKMTSEATDIPQLDTLVMATPKSDVVQIVGRVIRFLDGKKEPVVFDVVDDTSTVFNGYATSRLKWYAEKGAEVDIVNNH